ncbi:hypothetical protein MKEN_00223100 [Mycena kentingensis (nom. inval.)]|nr:hypothetical protein MKEN_00223100 [Mycena kentingensis (nom. inval.)]
MLRSPGKRAWRRQETARREPEKLEREQERQRNAPVSTLLLSSPPIPVLPTPSLPTTNRYIRPTPTAQRPVIVISLGRDVPPLILDANPRNLATMGPRDRLTTLDVVLAEMAAGPPTPPAAAASPVPNPAPIPAPILAVNNSPREPERWSGLRDPSAHPWRSLRRRKQRLRGSTLPWTRIPADVAYGQRSELPQPAPILRVHAHPPSPPPPRIYASVETQTDPPPSSPAVHPSPSHADDNSAYEQDLTAPVFSLSAPKPPAAPAHRLPARMAYGIVDNGLALVCGQELPNLRRMMAKVLVYAFPDVVNGRPVVLSSKEWAWAYARRKILDLSPTRRVFLAAITHMMDLDERMRRFLQPAVLAFVDDWLGSVDDSGIS